MPPHQKRTFRVIWGSRQSCSHYLSGSSLSFPNGLSVIEVLLTRCKTNTAINVIMKNIRGQIWAVLAQVSSIFSIPHTIYHSSRERRLTWYEYSVPLKILGMRVYLFAAALVTFLLTGTSSLNRTRTHLIRIVFTP